MARAYAPAMTKQAFKAVRPKGNYDAYLGYLERHRPGWSRPQAARPQRVGPPMRGPSYTYDALLRRLQILNPRQMEQQANRMAGTQLKYQRSLLADEYRQAQADAARRMQLFAGAGRAAAAMNAGLIGQVGGQYQAGADQLSQMAAAGAAQMSGATDASVAAANAAAANVGMPGVTVGGPVGQPGLAGPTQAGVESYYGGTLPAQALTNAGGYAQAGMAGQISAQNLRATQEAQMAYLGAMNEAGRNRASAMKEMVAGRPQMAMQYLQQLQDNQRQAIALASSMVGAGFEQGMVKKEYGQKVKQQKVQNQMAEAALTGMYKGIPTVDAQKIQAAADAAAIDAKRIDASASRAWGYLIDKAGNPILDPRSQQPIPVARYTSGGRSKSGLTANQMQRQMEKARNLAEELFYGYGEDDNGKRVPISQLGSFDPNDSSTWGTGNLGYGPAKRRLQSLGLSQGQATAILNEYYDRGDSGRPVFTPTEKKQIVTGTMKKWKTPRGKARKAVEISLKGVTDALARGDEAEADRLIAALLAMIG